MSEHREYCENCGVAIGEPSAFCGNCGAALSAPEPIAATATAAGVPAHSEVAGTGTPPTPTQRGSSQATQTPGTTRTTTSGIDTGAHRREAPPLGGTPPPGAPPTGAPPAGAPIPASEQPSEKSRKWIPFAAIGGGALLVLAMVAALLLALGGSAGKNVTERIGDSRTGSATIGGKRHHDCVPSSSGSVRTRDDRQAHYSGAGRVARNRANRGGCDSC